MNLTPLFKAQKKLDARIVKEKGLEGQDLLDKKILALQVELGELANEWRGFKFWSEHQEPVTAERCDSCGGIGYKFITRYEHHSEDPCPQCNGSGIDTNPILEEYVDCLHFILSIGNEIEYKFDSNLFDSKGHRNEFVIDTFLDIYSSVHDLYYDTYPFGEEHHFEYLILQFVDLGEQLNFSWEQIRQAYFAKNKINFKRQQNGY